MTRSTPAQVSAAKNEERHPPQAMSRPHHDTHRFQTPPPPHTLDSQLLPTSSGLLLLPILRALRLAFTQNSRRAQRCQWWRFSSRRRASTAPSPLMTCGRFRRHPSAESCERVARPLLLASSSLIPVLRSDATSGGKRTSRMREWRVRAICESASKHVDATI